MWIGCFTYPWSYLPWEPEGSRFPGRNSSHTRYTNQCSLDSLRLEWEPAVMELLPHDGTSLCSVPLPAMDAHVARNYKFRPHYSNQSASQWYNNVCRTSGIVVSLDRVKFMFLWVRTDPSDDPANNPSDTREGIDVASSVVSTRHKLSINNHFHSSVELLLAISLKPCTRVRTQWQ